MIFCLLVGRIGFLGDLLSFFVQITGLLPLPAVFFGSFFANAGTLPFSYLVADVLEVLWVFFPVLARRVPPFFPAHWFPFWFLSYQDYTLRLWQHGRRATGNRARRVCAGTP
jgi:hypothetical protein